MLTAGASSFRHWLKCLTICLGFFGASVFAEALFGTVIAVHDGDTITLKNESGQKKIRLAGIDSPELSQPYGVESRAALRESVLGKQVQIETSKNDKYGRIVGRVLLDGVDINLKQVKSGVAWAYRAYLKELSKDDRIVYFELLLQDTKPYLLLKVL